MSRRQLQWRRTEKAAAVVRQDEQAAFAVETEKAATIVQQDEQAADTVHVESEKAAVVQQDKQAAVALTGGEGSSSRLTG